MGVGDGSNAIGFAFNFSYNKAGGTVWISSFDNKQSPYVLMQAAAIELPASSSNSRAVYWVVSAHVGPQTL
jgi:hypothetical protein